MEELMSLMIVGSVALDSIKSPHGEHKDIVGGSAVHASTAASFYGPVNLVGVVGEDFPKEHIDFLCSRGINTEGLEVACGKTFRWVGYYEHDMNHAYTVATELNVFSDFVPKIPEKYKKSKYVFLGNIQPSLQLDVLNLVKGAKVKALDTMNLWIKTERKALLGVLKKVDILFINDAEIRQLTGEPNLIKAAKKTLNMGSKYIVVKKGEHGALIIGDNLFFACPAFPVDKLSDPTGAVDTFAGGFMGYLSKTDNLSKENLKKAVVVGTVMSSFNVEEFSLNRLKSLTTAEIFERYNNLMGYTSFTEISL